MAVAAAGDNLDNGALGNCGESEIEKTEDGGSNDERDGGFSIFDDKTENKIYNFSKKGTLPTFKDCGTFESIKLIEGIEDTVKGSQ